MSSWWAGFGIGVGCWLGFNAALACLLRGPRERPSPTPDLDRLDAWDPWPEFDRVTAEKGTCW